MLQPHQITGRLWEKGTKVSKVAKDLNVDPSTVSTVITRQGTSKRIMEYIANILGEPFESVWGPRSEKIRRHPKRV